MEHPFLLMVWANLLYIRKAPYAIIMSIYRCKGKVVKWCEMIKAELMESVESIKVNQVSAANFGVPQRRDRVIIIGGSEDLTHGFSMREISYVPKNGQISILPPVIGVEDAIGDLPPLQPGEDGSTYSYRFPPSNPYQKFMRGEILPEEYLRSYMK